MNQPGLPQVFEDYSINDVLDCLLDVLTRTEEDSEYEDEGDSQMAEECLRSLATAGGVFFEPRIALFVRGHISQLECNKRRA